jgi:mRNA interferase RelE/StbE
VPDYHVVIKPSAAKDLDKLPVSVAARIAAKIDSLAHLPRPHGIKKLEGEPTRWRIRVSDWRVIFAIDDGRHVVDIIYIRHCSKAYE